MEMNQRPSGTAAPLCRPSHSLEMRLGAVTPMGVGSPAPMASSQHNTKGQSVNGRCCLLTSDGPHTANYCFYCF